MNIIITGSLGNISNPLAKKLVHNEHAVTVISSKADKRKDIETIGAKAAIGSIDDVKGLPTVQQIAEDLNISPTYLSTLLKALTGQSTQQHIHEKLIEKAKQQLSTTNLSVSEIAIS